MSQNQEPVLAYVDAGILHFSAGITLADLSLTPSVDHQFLLIYCHHKLVAYCSAMGSNVDGFAFINGSRYSFAQLLDRLSANEVIATDYGPEWWMLQARGEVLAAQLAAVLA
ncbi:MAG TPA: hypothetical protein VI279_13955 [Rhodocyclaceae bacterium]